MRSKKIKKDQKKLDQNSGKKTMAISGKIAYMLCGSKSDKMPATPAFGIVPGDTLKCVQETEACDEVLIKNALGEEQAEKMCLSGCECVASAKGTHEEKRTAKSTLLPVTAPEARAALRKITHIFTDLDGTLFAPGGTLLTNHDGEPSVALAQVLCSLKQVGIEVIIVTGRSSDQGLEMLRILNVDTFVGEMGATVETCDRSQGGKPKSRLRYLFGEQLDSFHGEFISNTASNIFSYTAANIAANTTSNATHNVFPNTTSNITPSITPAQLVSKSGVVERLFALFPDCLERYPNAQMTVSTVLQGSVDVKAVNQFLATQQIKGLGALVLLDNGIIRTATTKLAMVTDVHIYHLLPAGVSKAAAVQALMAERGIARNCAVAIGDSLSDLAMGDHAGTFVVMRNGLKHAGVRAAINRHIKTFDRNTKFSETEKTIEKTIEKVAEQSEKAIFYTTKSTADGWVEFAQALLAAKQDKCGEG